MMPSKSDAQMAAEVAELRARLAQVKPRLMSYPNVLDVYPGIKTVRGRATDVACFIVEVERKVAADDLTPESALPPHVDGDPVDVYERRVAVQESQVYCGGVALNGGTLGMFALTTAANTHLPEDTPVMVTNHHVASRIGQPVGVGSVCDCICSHCCEDGVIVDATRNANVDVAIASLSSETRFSHEILRIGPVRGSAAPTDGMIVSKYGKITKLTQGRVILLPSVSVRDHEGNTLVMVNQIRVVPHGDTDDVSAGGDSGSVYVQDETKAVVALHHAGSGNDGYGTPMPTVLTAMNIRVPVQGTAGAIPIGAAEASITRWRDRVATLERRLREVPLGLRWLELAERHVEEVRRLVNTDRRAKVVWQRVQGPGFLAHWMKSAREGDYRVPEEIAGMRIENAVLALSQTMRERGSQELATAVTDHYLTVLKLVRGCASAREFVDRVCAYAASRAELNHVH